MGDVTDFENFMGAVIDRTAYKAIKDYIEMVRKIIGSTFGYEAEPGTIRGDFGCSQRYNLIHGSDSSESAQREIEMFFEPDEIVEYELADSPWKTFPELIDYAKKNPGKVTYGTAGVGLVSHLAMEFVAKQEKIEWTLVPFPGIAPAITALLGGHLTAASGDQTFAPYVQAGKLRALSYNLGGGGLCFASAVSRPFCCSWAFFPGRSLRPNPATTSRSCWWKYCSSG
jgi:hypothetical protein